MRVSHAKEDSRERFLAATEKLFVEHGYKATTIRSVCSEANTSLAILNRNWPSKEALFTEMLKRHFDPLHGLQNHLLREVENQSAAPIFSMVIAAFFKPAFRSIDASGDQRTSVYSRALIDPSREIKKIVAGLIDQTRTHLIDLVRRALPNYDRRQHFIVMNLVFGAYVYPQAFGHQLASAMNVDDADFAWEPAADEVVAMLCEGIVLNGALEGTSQG